MARRSRWGRFLGHAGAIAAAVTLTSFAWNAAMAPIDRAPSRWSVALWPRVAPPTVDVARGKWPLPDKLPDRADALHAMLEESGYSLDRLRHFNGDVPRLFLARLPTDVPAMEPVELRKALFIKLMLPLILAENESILADRMRLLQAREWQQAGLRIPPNERAFLADLARRYGVNAGDLDELALRVDAVPTSLALAQAALETGWGTSRLATNGQALFGQIALRGDNRAVVTRTFEQLADAVSAYASNLNTHRAYGEFRARRHASRVSGHAPSGLELAGQLVAYSERGHDYVHELRAIMRVNQLTPFDHARLDR
jgi:Bax protein